MTRPSALGVLALLSLAFATSAPAEANHPLIQPPISIKLTRLNIPVAINDVMKKKFSGFDLEDKKTKTRSMAEAKDYIEIRQGKWDKEKVEKWLTACEKSLGQKDLSPFCKTELERVKDEEPARLPSEIRAARQETSDRLKAFEFEKLDKKSYQEVMQGLGLVGDANTVKPIGAKIVDTKGCVPSTISSAVGYKMEENFPEVEALEMTKALYKKSADCGNDFAAGQAAFRLGLIAVWQNKCGDVEPLMKKVEGISEASQYHSRAKYWRYFCANQAKNENEKTEVRQAMLAQHPMSFQNLAINGADDAMMAKVLRNDEPQTVFYRSVTRPDLNEIIRSAEALEKSGEPVLAGDYLDRNVSELNTIEPEARLYVAALLNRMQISLTKFKILSSLFQDAPRLVTKGTMQMMFPLQFHDVVRREAKDIDPFLILALMRQESAFNAQAVSLVGARGLMQVMPATARSIASVRASKLFDPKTNVGVGTKYLEKRLLQYRGDVELTLAAYNAGAARVDRWLKRYATDNKMLFLDFIPFKETREYVSSILRNYYWYVRLYNDDGMKVAAREAKKVQIAPEAKRQAIMAANAGVVAWQAPTNP